LQIYIELYAWYLKDVLIRETQRLINIVHINIRKKQNTKNKEYLKSIFSTTRDWIFFVPHFQGFTKRISERKCILSFRYLLMIYFGEEGFWSDRLKPNCQSIFYEFRTGPAVMVIL